MSKIVNKNKLKIRQKVVSNNNASHSSQTLINLPNTETESLLDKVIYSQQELHKYRSTLTVIKKRKLEVVSINIKK